MPGKNGVLSPATGPFSYDYLSISNTWIGPIQTLGILASFLSPAILDNTDGILHRHVLFSSHITLSSPAPLTDAALTPSRSGVWWSVVLCENVHCQGLPPMPYVASCLLIDGCPYLTISSLLKKSEFLLPV